MNTTIAYIFSFTFLQIGELVEDIFEFGFWTAIIIVVLVILIFGWLIKKFLL